MISCNLHDTIEIVCMYRYPVLLTLKSGEEVTGTAVDTGINAERQEYIKIAVDDRERAVLLETVSSMQVTTENPHINKVCFED